jgi:hypothetical protein
MSTRRSVDRGTGDRGIQGSVSCGRDRKGRGGDGRTGRWEIGPTGDSVGANEEVRRTRGKREFIASSSRSVCTTMHIHYCTFGIEYIAELTEHVPWTIDRWWLG